MNRKKYKITIKMTQITTMNHEQTSMQNAKEDVKKLIQNSNKETIDKIFTSDPIFVYVVEKA